MANGDKYVPNNVWLRCDKGAVPGKLTILPKTIKLYGQDWAAQYEAVPMVNIPAFGGCLVTKVVCVPATMMWSDVKEDVTLLGQHPTLDTSTCQCTLGGTVKIYFTKAAVDAAGVDFQAERDAKDNANFWGKVGMGLLIAGAVVGAAVIIVGSGGTALAVLGAAAATGAAIGGVGGAVAGGISGGTSGAVTGFFTGAAFGALGGIATASGAGLVAGGLALAAGGAGLASVGFLGKAYYHNPSQENGLALVGAIAGILASGATAKGLSRLPPGALGPGKAANALNAVEDVAQPKKCTSFGEPVDAASGAVFTQAFDFAINGPIPLAWERVWYSRSTHQGALGHGWHHKYDLALAVEANGQVAIRTAEGQLALFEAPVRGEDGVLNRTYRLELFLTETGDYRVWHLDERRWYQFLSERENHLIQPLTAISDLNGFSIQFDYNSANHLRQITDSAGRVLQVETNDRGQIRAIFSPLVDGVSFPLVRYGYDAAGNLSQSSNAEDHVNSLRYEGHLLVQRTTPRGINFFFRYDNQDHKARCLHTWGDGDILSYKFRYDSDSQTTIWNSYDQIEVVRHKNGLAYQQVNALGAVTNRTYNDYQELLADIDPMGNATVYGYDSRGHLTSQNPPGGGSQQTTYGGRDVPITGSDAQGGTWKWTYDERGNLTERVDPLGTATTYARDAEGHLVSITDATGQATQLRYDREHNLIHIASPGGVVRSRGYDELGRLISLTDPNGAVQRRSYDRLGQLLEVLEADGTRRTMQYDESGNVTIVQEGRQQVTFGYTALNQIAQRQQAGQRIQFGYDREGRLTGLLNEAGLAYQFELDAAGHVIAEQGFDGLLRRYERDKAGRMVRAIRPAGRVTDYTYAAGGQVGEVRYNDGTSERYRYNGAGLLVEASNDHTTVKLQRNDAGLLTAETQGDYTVSYEYDQFGQRTHIRSSLGADIALDYDQLGHVERMSAGGWRATFSYDQRGLEIQRQLSGGVSVGWQYDSAGRPLQQRILGGAGRGRQRSYQWRGSDRLAAIDDSQQGTSRYQYDPVGNLVGAAYADGTTEMRLADPVGNLFETATRQDRRYGPGGQLLSSPQAQYHYDAEGNLTRKDTAQGPWHYGWNGAGRLVNVTRPDGQQVVITYDALGRRVSKTYKGKTTRWVWEGDVPLHEWHELSLNDQPGSVDQVITWLFDEASFAPIAKLQGTSRQSILTDHLGTPLEMVDEAGQRTWGAQTTAYGRIRLNEGTRAACPFRFQGQYEDVETGLYYNRFRYYAPQEGMYISQDPIGLESGVYGLYFYTRDPNSILDPFGLDWNYVLYDQNGKPYYTGRASDNQSMADVARRHGNNVGTDGPRYGAGDTMRRVTPVGSDPDLVRGIEQRGAEENPLLGRNSPLRRGNAINGISEPKQSTVAGQRRLGAADAYLNGKKVSDLPPLSELTKPIVCP